MTINKTKLKRIIKEELQNYLNEASSSQCKDMLAAGEISPDQYQACVDHFEKDYSEVEDTGERAMDEAGALAGRKAAEDRIAAMKAGKPDKRDSALMKKIKQWSEEGKKIPKHLTVGRMRDD